MKNKNILLNKKIIFLVGFCFWYYPCIRTIDFPLWFGCLFSTSAEKLSSSFYDRINLLEDLLLDYDGGSDLNCALLARMTSGLENQEISMYIKAALDQAKKDAKPITLDHILAVLHDHDYGLIKKNDDEEDKDWLLYCNKWTAFHEAGHAVILACHNRSKILSAASIKRREKCAGFVASHDIYEDESKLESVLKIKHIKKNILQCLAGDASERFFGFDTNLGLKKEYCYKKWGNQAEQKLAIIARRGPRLVELFMNPGADQDTKNALSQAYNIMILEKGADVLHLTPDEKFEEQIKILSPLQDQTEELIELHKNEITKVAYLLLDHQTILGKDIYDVCGVNQPEQDFERIAPKFKLKK